MNVEYAVELFREMLTVSLTLVMPMLLVAMVVGIIVSLIQAVTSIQEQTLAFVPKLVAVVGLMMLVAYWIIEVMMTFTIDMFGRMSSVVG